MANRLRVVVPKGRIFEKTGRLLHEAGIRFQLDERAYRPDVDDPEIEIKVMKPQNVPRLLELGSHDVGFTGHDWIVETGSSVEELVDLAFDPVRIVAAVPESTDPATLRGRRVVVASEYETITRQYLDRQGLDYVFVRTYGATESFPPTTPT